MADIHGRLGAVAPAANTDASLYQAPGSTKATVKVVICNRGSTDTTARLAYVDGAIGAVTNEDYLLYDVPLPANGVIVEERVPVTAGHSLLVRFGNANCSASALGVQEDV